MLPLALLSAALAAPPGWTLAPFGVGVYVHGKPGRGVAYSLTQAAGIATLSVATVEAYAAAAAEDDATFEQWQGVSMAGVSVAAVSYLVSVLDGSRLHDLEIQSGEARARVIEWDRAMAGARPERAMPASERPGGPTRTFAPALAAGER